MFVNAMCENQRAMKVVRAIAGLAHGLHLTLVAEGIETPEQIKNLVMLGCTYGQGYIFSKPTPIAETIELTRSEPNWTF